MVGSKGMSERGIWREGDPVWWIEARFPSAAHPLVLRFSFRPTEAAFRFFVVIHDKAVMLQVVEAMKLGGIHGKAQNLTSDRASARVIAIASDRARIEGRAMVRCLRHTKNHRRRGRGRRGM